MEFVTSNPMAWLLKTILYFENPKIIDFKRILNTFHNTEKGVEKA